MLPRTALVCLLALILQTPASAPFPLDEATAAQLASWMASGRYTARQITELYLRRIEEIDRKGPALRSIGSWRR